MHRMREGFLQAYKITDFIIINNVFSLFKMCTMGLLTKHFLFFRRKLTWTGMDVREAVKAHFTCEMGLLEENITSTKADDGEDFFFVDVAESLLTQAYLSQPAAPLTSLTGFSDGNFEAKVLLKMNDL
jgi:hypothetical protein